MKKEDDEEKSVTNRKREIYIIYFWIPTNMQSVLYILRPKSSQTDRQTDKNDSHPDLRFVFTNYACGQRCKIKKQEKFEQLK